MVLFVKRLISRESFPLAAYKKRGKLSFDEEKWGKENEQNQKRVLFIQIRLETNF